MAQKRIPVRDPWKELSREARQVELEEVLSRLAVEERAKQALKKALMERVDRLIRAT
jgi:hypothetical protein